MKENIQRLFHSSPYSTHFCENGSCGGCDCLLSKLRSTKEGNEVLESRYRSGSSTYLGKERVCVKTQEDNTPVALCDATINGPHEAEIGYMTDPEYQGKGLGMLVVSRMVTELQKEGITKISALINNGNPIAAAIMARCGASPELSDFFDSPCERSEILWVFRAK